MNNGYRIAIACWLAPLLAGIGVYVAWEITRYDPLMGAGIFIIQFGTVLFFVGLVALVRGDSIAKKQSRDPKVNPPWTVPIGILLTSNFVVAGVVMFAAIDSATAYTVEIRNNSKQPLTNCRLEVSGRGPRVDLVKANAIVKKNFKLSGEGELIMSASLDGHVIKETIDDYVTPSLGGHTIVTIHDGGAVTFQKQFKR